MPDPKVGGVQQEEEARRAVESARAGVIAAEYEGWDDPSYERRVDAFERSIVARERARYTELVEAARALAEHVDQFNTVREGAIVWDERFAYRVRAALDHLSEGEGD